jgi:hypothetical protein
VPIILYAFAAIFIGRAIVNQNEAFPSLKQFSQGTSSQPLRSRYLMTPVLRWADTSPIARRASDLLKESSSGPQQLVMQFADALSLLALGPLVVRFRNAFSPPRIFPWLSPWLGLWIMACTYAMRYESRFYLPYDILSVAFFTAGLVACVEFSPLLLLLVFAVGTYNRETIIFLLPIWFACNFRRSRVKLYVAPCVALVIYTLIKLQIRRWTGGPVGFGYTWHINERLLMFPHHWPQLASVGGFLLLPVWLGRRLPADPMLKRVWLGYIPFVLVALLVGWWNETRIFGELTALFAVTASVEFEQYLLQHKFQPPLPQGT